MESKFHSKRTSASQSPNKYLVDTLPLHAVCYSLLLLLLLLLLVSGWLDDILAVVRLTR